MSALSETLGRVVSTGGELAAAPGVTGTVGVVVLAGAGGDLEVRIRLVDGRPVEAAEGGGPEPDLTVTLPADDARAVAGGGLEASVAFMRGRLKSTGDNGLLLGVLAATAAPEFGPWLSRITSLLLDV